MDQGAAAGAASSPVWPNFLCPSLPSFGRWLPGGAASALTSTATIKGGLLPMWAGAAVLAAYGLAFATAGTRFGLRKDIA